MSTDFGRKVILWTLVVNLSGLRLRGAANQRVVGKVVWSSGASLGGAAIPDGETIITGDVLSTAKGGSALVKLSATTQAHLGEETTVLFRNNSGRLSAEVSAGKLEVDTLGPDSPTVETSEYKTEPAEPGKAIYLVAVLPDKSTVITARRGKISIKENGSGRSYLLAEGYMAVANGNSPADPGQEKEEPKQAPGIPSGPAQGKPVEAPKSNKTLIIVLAGAAVAGGVGAAIAAGGGGGGAPASASRP